MSTSNMNEVRERSQNVKQDVREMGNAAAGAAKSGMDQVRDKAGDLRNDAQALGQAAKQAVQDQVSNLRDTANDYYEQSRDRARDLYDQGYERAMDFEQTLESRVREKPIQSVLMAGCIGFLLGVIWIRR